jgi:hypothetical protein
MDQPPERSKSKVLEQIAKFNTISQQVKKDDYKEFKNRKNKKPSN